ncbi:hypothetical protein B6D29_00705 [Microgenomates bacterium UTCPR1]|nr:MAG: hypothetical protein B6D29_00705 [Microgenomates bacterium UTCPR1]
MKYELEERFDKFGERIIMFMKHIKITPINRSIVDQLIRSATSIGANYFEANGSSSKKDFVSKITISKKEAMEVQHWFRMLISTDISLKKETTPLWDEAKQLGMIFPSIISKVKNETE